ncbi:neurogenic locus Notch protein-like [Stegodyphus dumicola]|uniref:neurogenic locus Notch protein-like n=1 Tax=Stegodyphus dumicola TaxID=202533 RepID=UPI0015ABB28C|nr:neurogenic locus Notch protein-like [Stegodyphus dumicola]
MHRSGGVCQCTNTSKQFDYQSKTCRVPCRDGDCENGAKCTGKGYKFCECLPGTTGHFCSDITECQKENFCGTDGDTTCMYDSDKMEAICQCTNTSKHFDCYEKACRVPCRVGNCDNGGKCVGDGYFKFCECLPGTTGAFCSDVTECQKKNFCGTDGDSVCMYDINQTEAICQCSNISKLFDYKQKICRVPCRDGNCDNGGKCTGNEDFKFCECLPETTGSLCSDVTECQKENFCGTDGDSICMFDSNQMEAVCQCSNSSKLFDYKQAICRVPCTDGDCDNGGKCTNNEDFKFCECLPGTTGSLCSDVTECQKENFCGINGDSVCIFDSNQMEAICQCSNISKLFDYKQKICRVPCYKQGTCQNGAVCTESFCECLPGTSSDFCEEISACENITFCGYGNETRCIYDTTEKTAVCECLRPDAKFNYLTRTCHCDCGVNGTCYFDSSERKKCICSEGFKEFNGWCNECDCGGNGTCSLDTYGEKKCVCDNGFAEHNGACKECDCGGNGTCSLDTYGEKKCVCDNGFAEHNGVCKECDCGGNGTCSLDAYGEKKCVCDNGFAELNGVCKECDCGDSGMCSLDTYGEKKCVCDYGFAELNGVCEEICKNDSDCFHGGECRQKICLCKNGTSGDNCQNIEECMTLDKVCRGANAVCSYNIEEENASCKCEEEGKIYNEVTGKCQVECKNDCNCFRGGECRQKICLCKNGTSGDNCQNIEECMTLDKVCRVANAVCNYNIEEEKASCKCEEEGKIYNKITGRCEGKRSKGYFSAILGTLCSVLFIFFSVLCYLHYKKQKTGKTYVQLKVLSFFDSHNGTASLPETS